MIIFGRLFEQELDPFAICENPLIVRRTSDNAACAIAVADIGMIFSSRQPPGGVAAGRLADRQFSTGRALNERFQGDVAAYFDEEAHWPISVPQAAISRIDAGKGAQADRDGIKPHPVLRHL
jgi:hypothetical protein